MANNESLKMHLKMLKELFPKEHKHFRISQAATDQLTCQFVDGMGNKYDIHATIPDSYPLEPVIWYTDSEEANVMEIVGKLSEANPNGNITIQIDVLLRELCHLHNIQIPKEAMALMHGESSSHSSSTTVDEAKQMPDRKEGDEIGDSDDMDSDQDELTELDDCTEKTDNEPPSKVLKLFPRIVSDSLSPSTQRPNSNSMSTNRLMKEIQKIYLSDSYKNGDYDIELVDDSFYNWNVELRSIDKDSNLYQDLMKLKRKEGKDCIVLNFTFNDKYPIEPPFVRIVYPVLVCHHVVGGGALCTELLLKQCWSPLYTIEAVIIQIAALLVKGNARIDFDSPVKYSLAAAKSGFIEVTSAKSSGWFDSFKESS